MKTRKFNYRHLICVWITIIFIALSVLVYNSAFYRVGDSIIDFFNSIIYYFCFIFGLNSPFDITVNNLPIYPGWVYDTPVTMLPETLEIFAQCWEIFIVQIFQFDNFMAYLYDLSDIVAVVSKALLLFVPIYLLLTWVSSFNETTNNDYNVDSSLLKVFKNVSLNVFLPIKNWVSGFISFLQEDGLWLKIWLVIWLYNLNIVTVFVEFLAFYFYFVCSFDLSTLYIQVYKLALDLWLPYTTIPIFVFVALGIWLLDFVSVRWGYNTLDYNERCNRAFINQLGVVSIVDGNPGVGKTTQITDMALSQEVQLLDDALEIILETDFHFPNFPWIVFENCLKVAIQKHQIYDVWSCRKYIRKRFTKFYRAMEKGREYYLYDYDYKTYGLEYCDNLVNISLWESLENYACAYFVYTVQSSYILSNYSIRSDVLIDDIGNFPLRNADFFKRDARYLDILSKHSHILDNDMLRLGRTMIEDNPNRYAFGFGVYVYSEIDKDRKNQLELRKSSVKASADETNQENDLFNALWKMSRHACVIANRPFVRLFADLQRSSSLGSDLVEIGNVLHLDKDKDKSPVLPFYSPFYWFSFLRDLLRPAFINAYLKHRYSRGDNTLSMFLYKNIYVKLDNFIERRSNLFNCQKIKIGIESGLRNGNVKWFNYFRMDKKIYSKRFRTDCLSSIFESRAELNTVGLDDLVCYADIYTKWAEVGLQNSYFYREINSLNNKE